MKKILLLIFITSCTLSCQDYGKLELVSTLPASLKEISGMYVDLDEPKIWAINDSGNTNEVFKFDPETGKIEKVMKISNTTNVDWEDMAWDGEGSVFIGDFGNNANDRKDLVIYTVKYINSVDSTSTTAYKTTFFYEDQTDFPPKGKAMNFDVEAFIFAQGHFYLFTRNRSTKFDGTVKLYRMPAFEGNYRAQLIDSIKICDDRKNCQITSADYDPTTGTVALLSYNKVWLLSNYQNDQFFTGDIKKIKLDHISQKESIAFKDSLTLYIADEGVGVDRAKLYRLNLEAETKSE